jgi:tetratricopeptide (TPR) repeat protein
MGRYDEAIAEAKRAQELDPLSVAINGSVGAAYYFARKYDQAIEQFKKTLQMDPDFGLVHWDLAETYAQKKMAAEAVAEWQTVMKLNGNPALATAMGKAYTAADFPGFLETWLDGELKITAARQREFGMALLYARLGKKKEAVSWLEKAYSARSGGMARLKCDPALDPLRSDPDFQAIIKRMNFPE